MLWGSCCEPVGTDFCISVCISACHGAAHRCCGVVIGSCWHGRCKCTHRHIALFRRTWTRTLESSCSRFRPVVITDIVPFFRPSVTAIDGSGWDNLAGASVFCTLSYCSADRHAVCRRVRVTVALLDAFLLLESVWFQASAAVQLRSSLLWDVTQRVVVVIYRRFGTTCRSPERWVVPNRRSVITNIPVRNVPEERISLLESVC